MAVKFTYDHAFLVVVKGHASCDPDTIPIESINAALQARIDKHTPLNDDEWYGATELCDDCNEEED